MPIAEWANEWDLSRRSIGSLWSRVWQGRGHWEQLTRQMYWGSANFMEERFALVWPALMYSGLHAFRYVVSRSSPA